MTQVEARFALQYREADTEEPGLVLEDDGSVWLVAPGGSRSQIEAPVSSRVSLQLGSSEMLALGSSPVEIVSAPGEGKMLVPIIAFGAFRSGASAYVFDAAYNLFIQAAAPAYNGWPLLKAQGVTDTMVDLADSAFTFAPFTPNDLGDVPGLPNLVNQALQVALPFGATDPTDGDGTLDVMLIYSVMSLA